MGSLGGMIGMPSLEELMARLGPGAMSPQVIAAMQGMNPQGPPQPQAPSVQTPAPQTGTGGKIKQVLGNPQLLQTIAMGLMAALGGKNKGYMMKGFGDQIQQQNEIQRQLQESQRQEALRREQLDQGQQGLDIRKYEAQTQRGRWEAEDTQAAATARAKTETDRMAAADKYRGRVSDIVKDFIQKEVDNLPTPTSASDDHAARVQIGYTAAKVMGLEEQNPTDQQKIMDLVRIATSLKPTKKPAEKESALAERQRLAEEKLGSLTRGQQERLLNVDAPVSTASPDVIAQMKKRYADLKKLETLGKATPEMLAESKGIEDALQITRTPMSKGEPPEEYWLSQGTLTERTDASTSMRPFDMNKAFESARRLKEEYAKNKAKAPTPLSPDEKKTLTQKTLQMPDADFAKLLKDSIDQGEITPADAAELQAIRQLSKAQVLPSHTRKR